MRPASAPSRVTLLATLALLAITASWGSTFFLIHDLLDRVPVLDFLAVRFTIASVAIAARLARGRSAGSPASAGGRRSCSARCTASRRSCRPPGSRTRPPASRASSPGCTSWPLPCSPRVLLRSRIGGLTWVAVLLAITGLGVLTLGDVSSGLGLGYGEALTLVSALIYALHIVGLGAWSNARDALGMSIVQCIVIAVICTVAAAPGGIVLPADDRRLALGRLHGAVRRARPPCSARPGRRPTCRRPGRAIIMSMEPVFAALFAVLLGGESATAADAARRRAGARRHADRRAGAPPQDRGRGLAHRRLTTRCADRMVDGRSAIRTPAPSLDPWSL